MKTLQEKYNLLKEGRFAKAQFLRDVRLELPNLVSNLNGFEDTVSILKNRGIIAEQDIPKYKGDSSVQYTPPDQGALYSVENLERGIRIELEKAGCSPSIETPTEEQYEKAKLKAHTNLQKDRLYYVKHLLSADSAKDAGLNSMVQYDGKNTVDKLNSLVKAALKEARVPIDEHHKRYYSTNEVLDFAKNAGKIVLDAKAELTNLAMMYIDEHGDVVPTDEIKTILDEYGLEWEDAYGEPVSANEEQGDNTHFNKVELINTLRERGYTEATINGYIRSLVKKIQVRGREEFNTWTLQDFLNHFEQSSYVNNDKHNSSNENNIMYTQKENEEPQPYKSVLHNHLFKILQAHGTKEEIQQYFKSVANYIDHNGREAYEGMTIAEYVDDFIEYMADKSGDVDSSAPLSEEQVIMAFKKLIREILSNNKRPLNEAAAANLERFVNYENSENDDLARRVRKAAHELSDIIYQIEKEYLKVRDSIEDLYSEVGPYMSPTLSNAFKRDLEPVMKKYFKIDLPKNKTLSDEEKEAVEKAKAAGVFEGREFSLKNGKLLK